VDAHVEAALGKEEEAMATKTNGKGKSTVAALAQQLIAGTDKHLGGVTQVQLASSSFTPAQIKAQLQRVATLRSDVDAARATIKAKLAVEATDMPALRTFMDAFVTYVKAAFAGAPDVLADFGLHPRARATLTVGAKAAAAAKRAATRAARNTMGSKQKLSVKGDVVGITVTPVTAAKPAVPPVSPKDGATSVATPAGTTSPAPTVANATSTAPGGAAVSPAPGAGTAGHAAT
jgi:hypothetical protein